MPPAGDSGIHRTAPDDAAAATAPARWLLGAGVDGVVLTQTGALARAVVREAAERWRGRELAADPRALLDLLATDPGGGEPFDSAVAAAVIDRLDAGPCEHDELVAAAWRRVELEGWRGPDDEAPTAREVSWVVRDVLCRGEAYGVLERRPDAGRSRFGRSQIVLTAVGKNALGLDQEGSVDLAVLVFEAQLMNVRGVRACIAVEARQHLTALHDAIQEAFGWWDDHLYSFWLDGNFWGDQESEFTTPETPDEGIRTADLPMAELDLAPGARLGYVFDFGDDWRVRLTLREQTRGDGGSYPRVLSRTGTAPPQYPGLDDE